MGKRSAKNNRKRGGVKVSRKSSSKKDKFTLSTEAFKAKFDVKKTIKENYAKAGFVDTLNRDAVIQAAKPARLVPGEVAMEWMDLDSIPDIRVQIKSAAPKNKQKGMSPDDEAYLRALAAKHGVDFKAMCKDAVLNSKQLSAQQLASKMGKLPKDGSHGDAQMEE